MSIPADVVIAKLNDAHRYARAFFPEGESLIIFSTTTRQEDGTSIVAAHVRRSMDSKEKAREILLSALYSLEES